MMQQLVYRYDGKPDGYWFNPETAEKFESTYSTMYRTEKGLWIQNTNCDGNEIFEEIGEPLEDEDGNLLYDEKGNEVWGNNEKLGMEFLVEHGYGIFKGSKYESLEL